MVSIDNITCRLSFTPPQPELMEKLDQFVCESPYPSYIQRNVWAKIAPLNKLQGFAYVWCQSGEKILTFGLLRVTKIYKNHYLGFFLRGPIFQDIHDFENCLPAIKKSLKDAGVCTLILNPRWQNDENQMVSKTLEDHGFIKSQKGTLTQHTCTALIDLSPTEDDIFSSFEKRCRRDIRAAHKKGLKVRTANRNDAVEMYEVYKEMAKLRDMDILGQPNLVKLWEAIDPDKDALFLVAEFENKIIGGIAVVREGNRALPLIVTSLPVEKALPRTHIMLWESMKIMKQKGCLYLDMGGLPSDEDIGEAETRRAKFKKAFRAKEVKLVPAYMIALRPVCHMIFFRLRTIYQKTFLRQLIGSMLKKQT